MIQRHSACVLFIILAMCSTIPAQDKPAAPAAQATPATPAAAPAQAPATTAAPVADAGSDLVVLKVQGEPISEKTVLAAIRQIAAQRPVPTSPDEARNVLLFQGAVDNLISSAVLKHQARQMNAVADPAKVDQQMKAFEKQFPTPGDFQKALAAQKVTEAELRTRVEETVRVQQLIDQAVKDVPEPTDAEIQTFYDTNPKSFLRPERVHAAHILLLASKNATPEKKAEVKARLEGIRADIEAGKITFEDAAIKFSEDKSNAPKGGDLGLFSRGRMVKPFEDAAFAAQAGTMTPVVETDFGFHIIKVIEHSAADTVSLDEAKGRIKQMLDQTAKRKVSQQYLADLKSKATIETYMTAEEFLKRHPEVK